MTGRRLPGLDQPQETRFFLIIAGWAVALGIVYWIVSGESAGTALLAGLALATGAMAAWLIRGRPPTASRPEGRRAQGRDPADAAAAERDVDRPGGERGGVDRPFHDEEGRLPDPTLAPFALGLGVALAATGPVFGLAPVIVGAISIAWGALTWLGAARAEHEALDGPGAHEVREDPRA